MASRSQQDMGWLDRVDVHSTERLLTISHTDEAQSSANKGCTINISNSCNITSGSGGTANVTITFQQLPRWQGYVYYAGCLA